MLRPTIFVVDATENSKGEGGVEKAKGAPKFGSKAAFDEARRTDST